MNTALLAGILAASSIPNYPNPCRARNTAAPTGGAFGGLNKKNPFRGIACGSQPHWSKLKQRGKMAFRHIEGARDTSPSYRLRDTALADVSFRDSNPIPCAFLP